MTRVFLKVKSETNQHPEHYILPNCNKISIKSLYVKESKSHNCVLTSKECGNVASFNNQDELWTTQAQEDYGVLTGM